MGLRTAKPSNTKTIGIYFLQSPGKVSLMIWKHGLVIYV